MKWKFESVGFHGVYIELHTVEGWFQLYSVPLREGALRLADASSASVYGESEFAAGEKCREEARALALQLGLSRYEGTRGLELLRGMSDDDAHAAHQTWLRQAEQSRQAAGLGEAEESEKWEARRREWISASSLVRETRS